MRKDEREGLLRGCPLCGTPVAQADIGLRDFSWVNEALPGKLGLMDLDGVLTQASTGRVLVMGLKPRGAYIPTGERLTYALLAKLPLFDVWCVWDEGSGWCNFSELNTEGRPIRIRKLPIKTVANMVVRWWERGLSAAELLK